MAILQWSVVALAFPENLPSIRVMKKIGMRFHRDATVENLPHVLYEITRAEWAARQNPQ